MLKSVVWNGREMRDRPFDASSGADFKDVLVTVTSRSAQIVGAVRGLEDTYRSDAVVLCFPVERERWSRYGLRPDRIRSVSVTTTGHYSLTPLPAGEYYVIALPGSQRRAWTDPAFLAAAAPLASRVRVDWGGVATEHLDLKEVRRR
jgi:hypothetical protein